MANIKELRQRIGSVIKTRKMTQAMKMVAAAKFKRAMAKMLDAQIYAEEYTTIISDLAARIEPDKMPYSFQKNKISRQALIVITGDRGLCGGFNATVLKAAEKFLQEQKTEVDLYLFGNKAYNYFKNKAHNIADFKGYFADKLNTEKVEVAVHDLIERFNNKEIGKIWLLYNQFQSGVTSKVVNTGLLPFAVTMANGEEVKEEIKSDYFYEPDVTSVLDNVIHQYLIGRVYTAFLESQTGEQSARMAAMDAATDNAHEMIRGLSLVYNRTRQAMITSEITEIVSGAEALAH